MFIHARQKEKCFLSPFPYSTTRLVTMRTGCQLNCRKDPSQANPPLRSHSTDTRTAHTKTRDTRSARIRTQGNASKTETKKMTGENESLILRFSSSVDFNSSANTWGCLIKQFFNYKILTFLFMFKSFNVHNFSSVSLCDFLLSPTPDF